MRFRQAKFLAILAVPLMSLAAWKTAYSGEPTGDPSQENPPVSEDGSGTHQGSATDNEEADVESSDSETETRLLAAEEQIRTRIGIAPMLVRSEDGNDPVEELEAMNLIIEVTLEEVEAALAAAAATEGLEDDIEAGRLQQFGSYRYYLDPPPAETAGSDQ